MSFVIPARIGSAYRVFSFESGALQDTKIILDVIDLSFHYGPDFIRYHHSSVPRIVRINYEGSFQDIPKYDHVWKNYTGFHKTLAILLLFRSSCHRPFILDR